MYSQEKNCMAWNRISLLCLRPQLMLDMRTAVLENYYSLFFLIVDSLMFLCSQTVWQNVDALERWLLTSSWE